MNPSIFAVQPSSPQPSCSFSSRRCACGALGPLGWAWRHAQRHRCGPEKPEGRCHDASAHQGPLGQVFMDALGSQCTGGLSFVKNGGKDHFFSWNLAGFSESLGR